MLWILGDVLCFLMGAILLVRGFRSYRPTAAPRCRTCSYDLRGLASPVCPECGTQLTPETVLRAERCRRPRVIVLGVSLLVLSALLGVRVGLLGAFWMPQPPVPAISPTVLKVKTTIAGLRRDLISGAWTAENQPSTLMVDRRPLVPFSSDLHSIRSAIPESRLDAKTKAAAMVEIDTALRVFWNDFRRSHYLYSTKPANAQLVVPTLDMIDRRMDNLLYVLNGR